MPDLPVPDVSAIIPCHGQVEFLPAAIESVLEQTGVRAEAIVVDDGPDDAVADVCARYGTRLRLLRQTNAGVSVARNHGIERSTGRCLHFLDADDCIEPGMYARSIEALDAHPDWILSLCGTRFMLRDGTLMKPVYEPPAASRAFLRVLDECPAIGSMIVRREALARTGGFDPGMLATEDWDLFQQLARTGGIFGGVPEALFRYRIHPAGKSNAAAINYDNRLRVAEHGCAPDPRVKDPDPEFARGGDPALLPRRKARLAAMSAGLALGAGDGQAAAGYVRDLFQFLDGPKPPHDFLPMMYQQAAKALGRFDPPAGEIYAICGDALADLRKALPAGSPMGDYARKIEKAFRGPRAKHPWWMVWK